MAAQLGKDVLIKIDISGTFTTVSGARSKTLTLDQEIIDVTDSDSAAFREVLAGGAGVKSVSMELEGVFKDGTGEEAVRAAWFAGTTPDFQFVIPSFGTFEGPFLVSSLEYAGEYNDAAMYKMKFENAGAVTFT